MKRLLLAASLLALAGLVWWLYTDSARAPQVPVQKARRTRLSSTLVTNGRVEAVEWTPVHASRPGTVRQVRVRESAKVEKGAVVLELDSSQARTELEAAEARIAQAQAELDLLDAGGPAVERAALDSSLARARLELAAAQKEHEALRRLEAKKAATRQDLQLAQDRVEKAELEIQSLEKRRAALVNSSDRAAAGARLKAAQAAAASARLAIEQSVVRAPMAGVLYKLMARVGDYLQPGQPAAEIGRLDRVRIILYVDEPELGRVAKGMPVAITWDALNGRVWRTTIERTPTAIVTLGTRQIGEAHCLAENPDQALLPGTSVNATLESETVENALVIPKEALRRELNQTGVYVLEAGRLAWRPIETGVSSVTEVQVLSGLSEGDSVVLATGLALRAGMEVRPVSP